MPLAGHWQSVMKPGRESDDHGTVDHSRSLDSEPLPRAMILRLGTSFSFSSFTSVKFRVTVTNPFQNPDENVALNSERPHRFDGVVTVARIGRHDLQVEITGIMIAELELELTPIIRMNASDSMMKPGIMARSRSRLNRGPPWHSR
jgi:hypothetical protein